LVAVMIIAILVTLATPMYQRAVEKSRVAEVSMGLKRLGDAKVRIMSQLNMSTYNFEDLTLSQLDVEAPPSTEFSYSIFPINFPNAVCAVRSKGKNSGTTFLYLGEMASESCDCNAIKSDVCADYCKHGTQLFCKGDCDDYGMTSIGDVGDCK